MRRIIVAGLLAIVGANANAEWRFLAVSSGPTGATQYIDTERLIGTKGTTVKAWDLIDYPVSQDDSAGGKFLSLVGQTEYNCKRMESRQIYNATYVGNMGKGNVGVTAKGNMLWTPTLPQSMGEGKLLAVCAAAKG
jgi:hypothetical protein